MLCAVFKCGYIVSFLTELFDVPLGRAIKLPLSILPRRLYFGGCDAKMLRNLVIRLYEIGIFSRRGIAMLCPVSIILRLSSHANLNIGCRPNSSIGVSQFGVKLTLES